ncbi:MAG: ABC transporter permease [Clostridia bacterium]|nr:ABC transporter permease [Clostridia bacterium]
MNIRQSFMLALKSLSSSKMRSFLTMLGIIIGIAAVIILVSLMSGLTNKVVNTFEDLGANLITVNISGRGGNRSVSPADIESFMAENEDTLLYTSPSVSFSATVKVGNKNVTPSATGVGENYERIKDSEVQLGRHIAYADVAERTKNCVIGTYLVSELFDKQNPIGQTLSINGLPFTVVGVLKESGDSTEYSADNAILIPYTTAQQLSYSKINTYLFSAVDKDHIDKATTILEDFLTERFSSKDFFSVTNLTSIVDELNSLIGTMTTILVGIAAISLLVGGIGIMNIMLVSVTERIREIGIRKSLGATPWDILGQFVVEACVTSGAGGVIGILLGMVGAAFASKIIGIEVVTPPQSILIAFSVSTAIGIIFGYLPAKKASRLNPIDALRHD